MSAAFRAATDTAPRPKRLRIVRPGERAPRPAPVPREDVEQLPFEQRVGIALIVEALAGVVSLTLVAPLGWGALVLMPVTVAVLVWWLTR